MFKRHPIVLILITIILFFCVIAFFIFKPLLGGNSLYGNRLDGIENVKISENTINQLCININEKVKTDKCNTNLRGKILNININLSEDVKISTMEKLLSSQLELFNEDELLFYDIQVFIISNSTDSIYPIIGYKNNSSKVFVWSNNG